MNKNQKFILLDRDGTINVEKKDYVKSFDEFVFLDGAIESLKILRDNGFNIIIITNQSPIGRGIISHDDLKSIHSQMISELSNHGVEICDVFYCPSIPSSNDFNRKPNPGMLISCSEKHNINLSETYFIGDKDTDIEAGQRAGCKTILLKDNKLLEVCEMVIKESD